MSKLYPSGDSVTAILMAILFVLLALIVLLPGVIVVARKITRVPFRAGRLRWLYLVWILAFASVQTYAISRDVNLSVGGAGVDNFIRLGFLSLGLFTILFIGTKYRFAFVRELTSGVLGIFFVFALWSMSTALWSVYSVVTLYKVFEYLVILLLVAFAIFLIKTNARGFQNRLLALKTLFDWHWFLIFLLLVSVYLGALIWPDVALLPHGTLPFVLQGAFPAISANGVGELSAILGVVAFARMVLNPGQRLFYVPVFAFSIVTMILAQSRSALLGFFVGLAVVLIASRRFGLSAFIVALLVAVPYLGYSGAAYTYFKRGQTDENFYSLSSRTEWWETALEAFRGSPIGGYGAYAGGRYVLEDPFGETGASNVHSTYVEILIDTGAIGFTLFLVGLLAAWFWLFKLRSFVRGNYTGRLLWIESLGVFSILMVRSVFSVVFVWGQSTLVFGLFLILIYVVRTQATHKDLEATSVVYPGRVVRRRSRIPTT